MLEFSTTAPSESPVEVPIIDVILPPLVLIEITVEDAPCATPLSTILSPTENALAETVPVNVISTT